MDPHKENCWISSQSPPYRETVGTQCQILGSTQGSDRPTKERIKERSVTDNDTFGECHSLGFTRGSDSILYVTLQDGPEVIVDSTPGNGTHVTRLEGSITTPPSSVSKEIQDCNSYSHQKTDYDSQPAILKKNTDYTDLFKDGVSKDLDAKPKPVPVENTEYINKIKDTIEWGQK